MGNEKNRETYRQIIRTFEGPLSSAHNGLEQAVSKAHMMFLGGFVPAEFPQSDYGKQVLRDLADYASLSASRKKVEIAGAEREIATETEAYQSLLLATKLAETLVLPNFHEKTDVSNKIFNDIHNLGLAYLHSIVSSVAQEYVEEEEATNAKKGAVRVASKGIRAYDSYHGSGEFDKQIRSDLKKLTRSLDRTEPNFLRPYELVPTSQKQIYRGQELMSALAEKIASVDNEGDFIFKPNIIFPIAQGGNEFGIRIAHAYQDKCYNPAVYPLLYSIKTRKHRMPRISNDSRFLRRPLEGQDVLVVEDWVTTGNTLRGILNELEMRYPHEIRVATIKRDPSQSKVPYLNNYKFYVGSWSKYKGSKTDTLRS